MAKNKPSYQDLELKITELELEKKLKQSKNRFNAILKASEDMITIHKTNGEYIYYNGPTCYAITPKDIVGKMPQDLFDKDVSSTLIKAFNKVERTGKSETIEVLLDWLGEKRWFSEYIYPIKNNEGKIVELVKVCRDIHKRKIAELEFEKQSKEKEKQAKALKTSKQKIQKTLEILEKRNFSMDEASKIAKIGYWEHDLITNTIIWSDFVYQIFELDPKKGVPSKNIIADNFDKESQKRLEQATINLISKGIPCDIELKWKNSKNENVWIRNVAQPIYNQQNEIVGKRGVMQDITASKKAQQELEESKNKVQKTLDLAKENQYSLKEAGRMAKIGYWRFDDATETLFWSDAIFKIYGYDSKLGVPKIEKILSVYTKDSKKRILEALEKLTKKGIPYDIELEFTNFKNEKKWIRNIGEPIYNDNNEVIGRRGISQDITDKKLNEKNLDEKNKALNEAQRLSNVGSWQWNMITDEAEWSDEMYNIYGVNKKDFYPSHENVQKLTLQEDLPKIEKGVSSLLIDKVFVPFDFRIKRPSGEIRHLHIVALEMTSKESIFGVTKDVTERKKIEQENLIIQENYRRLFNNASISIWNQDFTLGLQQIEELKKRNIPNITLYLKENPNVLFSLVESIIVNKVNNATLKLFKAKNHEDFINRVPETFGEGIEKVFGKFIKAVWEDRKHFSSEINYKTLEGDKFLGVVYIPIPKSIKEQKTVPVCVQSIQSLKDAELENLRIQDNYKRLFNNATVSIWNEDFSAVIKEIDKLRKLNIQDITSYFKNHPEVVFKILKNLKVNKVNKATLELFKAKNNEEFLDNIESTFGAEADKVFGKLIEAIYNNKKIFTSEVNYKTLDGEEFAAIVSIPIPQTEIEQKIVPVSIQSIQGIKDAEQEKKKTLERLKESQKIANIGSWNFDISSNETEWSEETYRIWGLDYNKPLPSWNIIEKRIHKDDLELINKAADLAYKGSPYDIEYRICLSNKVQKTIRSICKPILENGKVVRLKGTNQDITEQKLIRDKIEKAEEMYRILTDNSNDLICLQEPDSTFKYISPSIKNLLGYEQSEFLGKTVFSIVHQEDLKPLQKAMDQKVFRNKVAKPYDFRIRHKEGHFVWFEFLSSPVYKDNKINYFVTSARDITQWVLAKKEIEQYQTSLQKLTTEMTLIEEKQKKEIASNIHDHLSQSLVISKMKINELKKKSELKSIDKDLKFVENLISEVLENSRKITYELSPPVLYQLGIIDALNWLLENVEAKHNIKCEINCNVSNFKLSDVKSILLFRCIQELVKNTIKYADATLITLQLNKSKYGLDIILKDNGVGFDTSILNNYQNHSGSGFGLFAVQERIKNIQGEFIIISEINEGTSVNIFIP